MTPAKFRALVWRHYRKEGRHALPWRKTKDIYRILVSEVMLQQTQVERVIPFYKNFIHKFPTAKELAAASLGKVLKAWQGLGYNRRAKMLRAAAQQLATTKVGTVGGLEALPGVGPYTARAVAAFAWNHDVVFIETNIRTAVIHHFFPRKKKVSDKKVEKVLLQALPKGKAREWYSALMDYGAALKRSGISHNARGSKYVKQPKFAGSLREVRGVILRTLSEKAARKAYLLAVFPEREAQVDMALAALVKEELIRKQKNKYALAGE